MKIKLYQCGGEQYNRYSEYPLGLGYLKSNCTGADIEIVKSQKDLTNCDMIGLSSVVHGLQEAINILTLTNIPVIIGGQGTLWEGLQKYPFKHIIIGEGEKALQDIIDGKTKDKLLQYPLIRDIDILNFPYRGKCPTKLISLMSSRGCIYNCAYCSSQAYWKRARYHSADYILEEIKKVHKNNPHTNVIYFQDDLFVVNGKRFNEFYEKWIKKEYNKKFKLESQFRANLFNDDIAKKMKAMGFKRIKFGAESGSDRVLKLYNKKTTVAQNQNAINIARKHGLSISASFIHGFPLATKEEEQATLDFIKKNKLTVGGWYKFQAFPGTKFYNGENPLNYNMQIRGE